MENRDMSMEEILASIRKIISEDKGFPDKKKQIDLAGRDKGAPQGFGGSLEGHSLEAHSRADYASDILDLNRKIQPDGSIQIVTTDTPNEGGGRGAFPIPKPMGFPVSPSVPGARAASATSSPKPRSYAGSKLPPVPSSASAHAASQNAGRETFASAASHAAAASSERAGLAASGESSAPDALNRLKGIPKSDGSVSQGVGPKTLESVVQEALKPLLGEWLDRHMPALIERIVREQIQRVFQKP